MKKVAFATNPHITFKDGVTVELEFTVPAGFPKSAIRCAANPDTTGKKADIFMSLREPWSGKVIGTAAFPMSGNSQPRPAVPGLSVPWKSGEYVLSVTASNITHSTGAGAFGLTVQVSGLTKETAKPVGRTGSPLKPGVRR